ncbi:hypothetical protein Hypma_014008 [Hypsizygus marmoreus]|uniref:Uncharacterized protein n=1 Tax=Hypsizygus marmoreus TaxID=39966 RepID=A0A369K984_HYPMA|nr:hypothetical protein Hypma_014008 [Hypsizygus marmoreus]
MIPIYPCAAVNLTLETIVEAVYHDLGAGTIRSVAQNSIKMATTLTNYIPNPRVLWPTIRPTYIFLTTLLATIQCVVAAPAVLERRAPNLQISLRETHKKTIRWHFALIVHAPGAATRTAQTVYEHAIDEKCMAFDDSRKASSSTEQITVTATLLSNGAPDDDTLRNRVKAIMKAVPPASQDSIGTGVFQNCFDFTVEAVRQLNANGYISADDYQKFRAYYDHDNYAKQVKDKTNAGTMKYCARGIANGCTPRAKPGAKGGAASPKVAAKPKPKSAGKPVPKKRQS